MGIIGYALLLRRGENIPAGWDHIGSAGKHRDVHATLIFKRTKKLMMVSLPVPPSVNHLFANRKNGKGRIISREYAAWRQEAGYALNLARPQPFGKAPVQVGIFIPDKTKGDLDNRIKALLDLVVTHKVIDDDRQVKRISIERHADSKALLSIMPFEERRAA